MRHIENNFNGALDMPRRPKYGVVPEGRLYAFPVVQKSINDLDYRGTVKLRGKQYLASLWSRSDRIDMRVEEVPD